VIHDLKNPTDKVWARPELYLVTAVFDVRESQIWPGELLPHLFDPHFQRETTYTDAHVRFYRQALRVALLHLGSKTPEQCPRRYDAELLNYVSCWTARAHIYGNDQIEKKPHFRPPLLDQEKIELPQSWRKTRYEEQGLSGHMVEDVDPESKVQYTGDQLLIIRTVPKQCLSCLQMDCEDADNDICINMMHLKEMLKQKSPALSFTVEERTLLQKLTRWNPVEIVCTALHNVQLSSEDRLMYLKGDSSKAHINDSYGAHSIGLALPNDLLQELVIRGRTYKSNVGSLRTADNMPTPRGPSLLPVVVLESVDVNPGYMEADASEEWEGPDLARFHHLLYAKKAPKRSMWQIMQPHHLVQYARLYGFAVALYSPEKILGIAIGQTFWYNTATKQVGIAFQQLVDAPYLWKERDWCLISWVPFVPPAEIEKSPYVLHELKSVCYTLSKDKAQEPETKREKEKEKTKETKQVHKKEKDIIWIYGRWPDWILWGLDFWHWCKDQCGDEFDVFGYDMATGTKVDDPHECKPMWIHDDQPVIQLGILFH
jgi:hypothetical protein